MKWCLTMHPRWGRRAAVVVVAAAAGAIEGETVAEMGMVRAAAAMPETGEIRSERESGVETGTEIATIGIAIAIDRGGLSESRAEGTTKTGETATVIETGEKAEERAGEITTVTVTARGRTGEIRTDGGTGQGVPLIVGSPQSFFYATNHNQ